MVYRFLLLMTKWAIGRVINSTPNESCFDKKSITSATPKKISNLGGIFKLQSWSQASKSHISGCTASQKNFLNPFLTVYKPLISFFQCLYSAWLTETRISEMSHASREFKCSSMSCKFQLPIESRIRSETLLRAYKSDEEEVIKGYS